MYERIPSRQGMFGPCLQAPMWQAWLAILSTLPTNVPIQERMKSRRGWGTGRLHSMIPLDIHLMEDLMIFPATQCLLARSGLENITDARSLGLIRLHPTGWSSQPYGSFASQPFQPSPKPHGDSQPPHNQWGYPNPYPQYHPPQDVGAMPPGGDWDRDIHAQSSARATPLRTVHSPPINLMDADDLDKSPPGHSLTIPFLHFSMHDLLAQDLLPTPSNSLAFGNACHWFKILTSCDTVLSARHGCPIALLVPDRHSPSRTAKPINRTAQDYWTLTTLRLYLCPSSEFELQCKALMRLMVAWP